MTLWSGRFEQAPDHEFHQWQRSLPLDRRLLPYECEASRAYARMLLAAGVLTAGEQQSLDATLEALSRRDPLTAEDADAEDVHDYVERQLTAALGPLGRKLHTGRSRNEQIATDLRLFVRDASARMQQYLHNWAGALLQQARQLGHAVMPSYTHMQRAEPVLAAHWLLAYVEMALRDIARLRAADANAAYCPLGSGAVAGATLPLERTIAARALGFTAPTGNSMDATSDRDFVLEFLHALSQAALHLSRFAEEITLFSTAEFGYILLPEAFSTGSSAMPQKKNSDLTELVRGQTGAIMASAHSVEITLKGLPLAYNKDLQEIGRPLFSATDAMTRTLSLVTRFTGALHFDTERMARACATGYLNAMAAATYLSRQGVPFRDAHEAVGAAVRVCIDRSCELNTLTLQEWRSFHPHFGPEVYDAITLQATINCHDVIGGTAVHRVSQALAAAAERLHALHPDAKEAELARAD